MRGKRYDSAMLNKGWGAGGSFVCVNGDSELIAVPWDLPNPSVPLISQRKHLKHLLHINTRMQCMDSRSRTLCLERHQDVWNRFSVLVDSHVGASAGICSMTSITKLK